MEWHESKESEITWVCWADRFYITARTLYWKNIIYICMLLGAHAIELYLKAFLIYKHGKYMGGHNLVLLYRECQKLDSFFNDKNIAKHFVGRDTAIQRIPEQWADYSDIVRYPEALPMLDHRRPKSFGIMSGSRMRGSTF